MVLDQKTLQIQTLQGLVDRLSAPDLTASESDELRPRLFLLLASINGPAYEKLAEPPVYRDTQTARVSCI